MIVKSVVLRCTLERAFALFTEQAGAWWPADRRHTADASSEIRLDALGRFVERASDGTEVDLGVVRAFERPTRLMLDWYPGTGTDHPTRVEVTFEAADTGTRVTVKHDVGAAGGELFDRNAPIFRQAWEQILAGLAGHQTATA